MFGVAGKAGGASISVAPWSDVLFKADFSGMASVGVWSAVFTMTMVIVFETVGLTNAQVMQLKLTEKLPRILKASSLTAFLSGLF
ncbi:NCS2 family permease, partial [Listeria monocytogenes]|nr:NCS2 family permease [Listeria monocytogenes]